MKNEERGEEEREKKGKRIPALARLLLLEVEVEGVPLEFGRSRSWSLDSGP